MMIFLIFVTCLKVYYFESHTEGLLHRKKKCESQILEIKIYFFTNHKNKQDKKLMANYSQHGNSKFKIVSDLFIRLYLLIQLNLQQATA